MRRPSAGDALAGMLYLPTLKEWVDALLGDVLLIVVVGAIALFAIIAVSQLWRRL